MQVSSVGSVNYVRQDQERHPEATRLNQEVRERQERLENLSTMDGMTPERKVERVKAIRDGIQELRMEYNQERAFRIPEEMKENAKRLAEGVKKAFPGPLEAVEEQPWGAMQEEDALANDTRVEEESERNGQVGAEEEFPPDPALRLEAAEENGIGRQDVTEKDELRITDNIFNAPEGARSERQAEEAVEAKKERIVGVEEEEDAEEKDWEEEKVGLGKLRADAEEARRKEPQITDYVFPWARGDERVVSRQEEEDSLREEDLRRFGEERERERRQVGALEGGIPA